MDAIRREEPYTIDDIYALPDGERAELIDGKIYFMSTPSRTHQQISLFLSRRIADHIDSNSGKCEIYPAPFAVFLTGDNTTYVEPDISVICDPTKLDEKGCHGAPDWVIEIVSPSSRSMDYIIKINKYHYAGVKEYWIIDPNEKLISVYNFEGEMTIIHYRFGEEVPVGIYNGFSIKFPENP
ncbi:MAG: Uma2 family endonuclease [Ruminococcaceae bacterium]|nr:Uma2 family endonuclease [Oscillospiraceae bacterium]